MSLGMASVFVVISQSEQLICHIEILLRLSISKLLVVQEGEARKEQRTMLYLIKGKFTGTRKFKIVV